MNLYEILEGYFPENYLDTNDEGEKLNLILLTFYLIQKIIFKHMTLLMKK